MKRIFISDVHISEGLSLGEDNSYDWLSRDERYVEIDVKGQRHTARIGDWSKRYEKDTFV